MSAAARRSGLRRQDLRTARDRAKRR